MRVLILGDLHIPYCNWHAIEAAAEFSKKYKPEKIIQLGDFCDQYAWSQFKRAPYAPSAEDEWCAVERDVKRFHKLFGDKIPMDIIIGNHDQRYMARAMEANLPRQIIKRLDDLFPYDNWKWHRKGIIIDNVYYCHGHQQFAPPCPLKKALSIGRSCVQGHIHKQSLAFADNILDEQVFGMSVAWLGDRNSVAAEYSHNNWSKYSNGWATVTDGKMPHLYPFHCILDKIS